MCQFQLKKKVKLQTHTLDAHGETCLCETYGKAFHIHQNHRATRKAIRQVIKQMMFVKTRLNVKTHLTNLAEDLLSTLHKSPQLQTATLNRTEDGEEFLSMADLDSEVLEILDNNWLEDDFTFTATNLFKPEALLSLGTGWRMLTLNWTNIN